MYNRPFNDSSYEQFLNEGKIMAGKCQKCGAIALPPRPLCISCFSSEMEWVQMKGEGVLAAFTDIFVAPPYMAKEGFGRNNPYVVGVVRLKDGPGIVARIVGVDVKKPETIKLGMALKAEFISKGEGPEKRTILTFKP